MLLHGITVENSQNRGEHAMNRIFGVVSAALAPALAVTVAALVMFTSWGARPARGNDHAFPRTRANEASPSDRLAFEAIGASAGTRANFLARGGGYVVFLGPTEAILVLDDGRPERTIVRIKPVGANERGA
jgi:hypothetical protein